MFETTIQKMIVQRFILSSRAEIAKSDKAPVTTSNEDLVLRIPRRSAQDTKGTKGTRKRSQQRVWTMHWFHLLGGWTLPQWSSSLGMITFW